ncbi:MAG TPA: DUF1761 domain-containing protein [Candidatus Saccharimonadales bacterium]|nr:DUF1761 domain-containing protein [Candidatus Saccharimonadales bacterium]
MDIQVSWLAVVLATLSSMVVGSIWYAKPVFGNAWIKLARLDEKNMANPVVAIGLTLVVSFLTAFVVAHVTQLSNAYFHNSFLQDALTTGFWLWLGLVAARFITHDAFENRPWKLTLMNISHEFVTIMIMALIIGLLKP